MKSIICALALAILAIPAFAAADESPAAKTKLTVETAEAKYTTVIDQRSEKIVRTLGLSDTNAATQVHDLIMAQYRALNDWHEANAPKLKAAKGDKDLIAKISSPLKELHQQYLAQLGQYLTPAQIETVKDQMTYGKVQFTYKGYLIEYPNLTQEQKAEVLRLLKEAREEAMDGGSSEEKSAIFNRYKGKINNYLSKQGVHPDKLKTK